MIKIVSICIFFLKVYNLFRKIITMKKKTYSLARYAKYCEIIKKTLISNVRQEMVVIEK